MGLAGAAGVGAAVGLAWLRTPGGNDFLRASAEGAVVGQLTEGSFRIGGLRTNLWDRWEVRDLALRDAEGGVIAGFRTLRLDLTPAPLFGRRVVAERASVDGLVLDLDMGADGVMNLYRVFGRTEPPPVTGELWAGLPVKLDLPSVRLTDASFTYRSQGAPVFGIVGADVSAGVDGLGRRVSVRRIALDGALSAPGSAPIRAEGVVHYRGETVDLEGLNLWLGGSPVQLQGQVADLHLAQPRLELDLATEGLALADLDPLVGKQGLTGALAGTVGLHGPLSEVQVAAELRALAERGGGLGFDGKIDLASGALAWSGQARFADLDLQALYPKAGGALRLDGDFEGGGAGVSWPDAFVVEGVFQARGLTAREYVITEGKLPIRLEDGVLDLQPGFEVAFAYGRFRPVGTVDLVGGDFALDVAGELVAEHLADIGIPDLAGVGPVRARVEGNAFADGLPMRARGEATLRDFRYGADVSMDSLFARFDARLAGGAIDVGAEVVGEGASTYGVALERLESPDLIAALGADGSVRAEGTGAVAGVVQPGVVAVADADLRSWRFALEPGKPDPIAAADLRIGAMRVQDRFPADGGAVTVAMAEGQVDLTADLEHQGRAFLVTEGRYGMNDGRLDLARLIVSPVEGARWVSDEPVGLRLTEGGVRDARISLRSAQGDVFVEGDLDADGVLGAVVQVSRLDLGTVDALLGLEQGLGGRLDLGLTLLGDGRDFALDGHVFGVGLRHSSAPVPFEVGGRIGGFDRHLDMELALGAEGRPLATASGLLPAVLDLEAPGLDLGGATDLRLALLPGSFERLEPWLEMELPEGEASAALHVSGTLRNPDLRASAVAELPVSGLDDRGRVELEVRREGAHLEVWSALYEGLQPVAVVDGTASTRLHEVMAWLVGEGPEPDLSDTRRFVDDLSVQLALTELPARSVGRVAALPAGLDGAFTGSVRVMGDPVTPRLSASVGWTGAVAGAARLGEVNLLLRPEDDAYKLDLLVDDSAESDAWAIRAVGRVPLAVDLNKDWADMGVGSWDLLIDGEGLPMGVLTALDPGVAAAAGRLRVEGAVRGALLDPRPDIEVLLEGGAIAYTPTGVLYDDLQLKADLTASHVRLSRLSFNGQPLRRDGLNLLVAQETDALRKGRTARKAERAGQTVAQVQQREAQVRARGSVTLKDWSPGAISLTADLNRALLVSTPDLEVRLSGAMNERGQAIAISNRWPDLQVRGSMSVDEARVKLDAASWYEHGAIEVDPALVIHRGEAAMLAAVAAEEELAPPLYESFDVDVVVDLAGKPELAAVFPFLTASGGVGSFASVRTTARLDGEVQARVEEGALGLWGEVELADGGVAWLTGTFDIDGGRIVFDGENYEDPILDIQASTRIQGATVDMRIGGTPSVPDVQLTSPEYADKSQVLSMLLTGSRPERAGSGLGASQTLALLAGNAQAELDLGPLRFTGTMDPDGAARVTLPLDVRGVSARVEISARPPKADRNTVQADFEVGLGRRGVAEARLGDRYSGAEVLWEFRF